MVLFLCDLLTFPVMVDESALNGDELQLAEDWPW